MIDWGKVWEEFEEWHDDLKSKVAKTADCEICAGCKHRIQHLVEKQIKKARAASKC